MSILKKNEPCPHCGRYANRGVSMDAVIVVDAKVLLVKRGVEPYKGYWATPGGYLDWDETVEEGLQREVKEETGLDVTSQHLVSVHSFPARTPSQVIALVYLVKVKNVSSLQPGDDAVDAKWWPLDALPDVLAFDHDQILREVRAFL